MSWIGSRRGPWLGPAGIDAKREPPKAARGEQERPAAKEKPEQYAVPYLPVRCPRCNRGDQVRTYSVHKEMSPPSRYHECKRCTVKFRSYEVEEGSDGRILLRRSN